jgi:hypothetical protein
MYVSKEVRHPLQRVRASQIRAPAEPPSISLLDAIPQYACLVCYSADNAATLCTVFIIVQIAVVWRPVMCVYPMPLVREAPFSCVCVAIRPSCSTAYRFVVLWLEDFGEYRCGLGSEESFGHEANLIVNCEAVSPGLRLANSRDKPSVFHATTGAVHAAAQSICLVSILSISPVCNQM